MALINKINVGGTHYDLGGSMLYGVCSTDSETVAKEVTVNGNFTLQEGAMVAVKFVEANEVASPTLNVNDTGAKPIIVYGSTAAGTSTTVNSWVAGAVQIFIYDGTNWIRDYWRNTTYTNASLGQGYATCSTAAATTAKTASLSSYSLTTGGIVAVKFTYDVPANATLSINSKTAKAIYHRGAKITAGVIKAGDIATFVYSSYYHLISIDRDNTFSGNYNDLTNKPTIPTVNNGTLTIQKNGTNIQTFTANQSSNVTANITVPTKTSELTNDSGFKTSDTNTTYDLAASASSTNGNVKLNLTAGGSGSGTDSVTIKGSGATTVTTDANGVVTISSTDNNTTYSAAGSSLGLVKSGGDVTISDGVITVNDDSHNHTIANVDGLQSAIDDIYYEWLYLDEVGYINTLDGESTNGSAYTGTTLGFTSDELYVGCHIIFVPKVTSTSTTPTLKVGNTPATGIRMAQPDGAGVSNLPSAGYLVANTPYSLVYNGTYWVLNIPVISGGASTIADTNLTASKALISDANGKVAVSAVTSTELGYLDGVTSAIQTQLNSKAASATTLAGYGITNAYTKTEITNNVIGDIMNATGSGLTIADAKKYAYDLNTATEAKILTTDAINALIDAKLGVIENGTY